MSETESYIKLHDVGDTLYRVSKWYKQNKYYIEQITISEVKACPHYVYKDNKGRSYFNRNILKSCFKTREEAEQEIQKRVNIAKKRERLKEYESQLNVELNIRNHFIVK